MSTGEPSVVRMGHDILRNLYATSDEQRVQEAATHIEKFWDPRMRRELVELVQLDDPRVDGALKAAARRLMTDDTDDDEIVEPSGG